MLGRMRRVRKSIAAAACAVLIVTSVAVWLGLAGRVWRQRGADLQLAIWPVDRSADPCKDFYQYACGRWIEEHPIRAGDSSSSRLGLAATREQARLARLVRSAAAPNPKRSPLDQRIGDDFAACTDERTIEAKGLEPLRPELDRIAALVGVPQLAGLIGHLHGVGVHHLLFALSVEPDVQDSSTLTAYLNGGGLGLPDRDDYLDTSALRPRLLKDYQVHLRRMFELLGESSQQAAADAKGVLYIETGLARARLDRARRRDPQNVHHRLRPDELALLARRFDWDDYFKEVGAPAFETIDVAEPQFFEAMNELLRSVALDAWKAYLRWHLVDSFASVLPRSFDDEDFEFHGKTLRGLRSQPPRWIRCVSQVDADLGEELAQRYLTSVGAAASRAKAAELLQAIKASFAEDLRGLRWMTGPTRAKALEKLAAVSDQIGAPEEWRDSDGLEIVRGDAFGNRRRARAFELRRWLGRIGKPLSPREWFDFLPQRLNAYYDTRMNAILLPASMLQPPLFDPQAEAALNFAVLGTALGHELTHAFDDKGRKFDGRGNLLDWWTERDAREFDARAQCLVDQYGGAGAKDVELDGRFLLGENIADSGGVRLAFAALKQRLNHEVAPPAAGFAAEQRFFLGYAQMWCESRQPESRRYHASRDRHAPAQLRVNGVLSNLPEFAAAFSCPQGSPMVRDKPCRVW
jgi:putative endopeptidase